MTDAPAPASRSEFLDVSVRIADYLCETSYSHGGQCTWVGSAQQADPHSGDVRFYSETLGPTLYAGTSGIALFLAETHSRTGNQGYAATAAAAMAYALARLSSIPLETRF